ncbi:discoidin domain-containing protein [Lentisphaera marina]|uniref:discoidin domain-containing protein n=1 Tax=Lentisphaera marina TaxID=1111041 RepID=UPI00236606DF|nr:discoidin domain-containing protein [Lentisphaera marina]MDD7986166.1 discoidin domain-containing protein [Lentisphaera marina]
MKQFFLLCTLLCSQLFSVDTTIVKVTSMERPIPTFKGGNVLDGSMKSRWSSKFEDHQELKIVLPKALLIESIEIHWEASYAKHYKIKTSEDKKKWSLVHVQKDKTDSKKDLIKLKEAKKVQYINFDLVKRGTQYGFSIFEIKLNGKKLKDFLALNGIDNFHVESIIIGANKKVDEQNKVEQKTSKSKESPKPKSPPKSKKTDDFIYI